MFFINFSFLFIAFQPFHTVSSITFNIMKNLFQQRIFEMHKAIAVLQLILKDFKPSPHDRILVDILWLK